MEKMFAILCNAPKAALALFLACGLAAPAVAGTTQASITVSATVVGTCRVAEAPRIASPAVVTSGSPSLSVQCTAIVPYTLAVNDAQPANKGNRPMPVSQVTADNLPVAALIY